MSYRDETDALRARAEGLEQDLARQSKEAAEGRVAKARASDLERQLERARARLAYLERRRNAPPGQRARTVAIVAGFAVALAGVGLVFFLRASPARPVVVAPVVAPPVRPVATPPPRSQPVAPASAPAPERTSESGTLDRAAIQRVLHEHMREVQSCYERELVKRPELAGKLVFDWTIAQNGSITSARLASSTMGSAEVATCILRLMRGWRFPPHQDQPLKVRYPFIFHSAR